MEKVIYKRLLNYLDKNKLIHDHQFGFRKGRSTVQAIHTIVENVINNIEAGDLTLSIFLDLSKAFDTVDHGLLLRKLEACGIRGVTLDWFNSYLTNRTQFTEVNGVVSSVCDLTCGVPQGSILGPLLFLIYIDGIFSCSKIALTVGFADDTAMEYAAKDIRTLISTANNDLVNIAHWFNMNKLSLNATKTKYMILAPRQKLSQVDFEHVDSVKISDVAIKRVVEINYLGVIIDDSLSWNLQIASVCSKVAKANGILSMVKGFVPSYLLRILYFSYVYPSVLYAISVWGSVSDYKMQQIQILQKRSVRLIANADFCAHTLPLFKRFSLLKIVQIYRYTVCLHTHSVIHNLRVHPTPYQNIIRIRAFIDNHDHNTRNHDLFVLPKCRTNFTKLSLLYNSVSIWNSLPIVIKNEMKLGKFKILVKELFMSEMI